MNQDGNPIVIDDLWALRFGNGITGTGIPAVHRRYRRRDARPVRRNHRQQPDH